MNLELDKESEMSKELLAGIVNEQQTKIYAEESQKQADIINQLQAEVEKYRKLVSLLEWNPRQLCYEVDRVTLKYNKIDIKALKGE